MTFGRTHMDQVFRRRLYGYRVTPPNEVWQGVQAHLHSQRSRKRRSYWMIAASFAFIMAAGTILFTQLAGPLGQRQSAQTSPQSFSNFVREPGQAQNLPILNQRQIIVQGKNADGHTTRQIAAAEEPDKDEMPDSDPAESTTNVKQEAPSPMVKQEPVRFSQLPVHHEQRGTLEQRRQKSGSAFDIPANNTIVDGQYSALSLKAAMSPVMSFRHVKNNSASHNHNTTESRLFSYSGGVNFGVNFSERLSVRSGVYYSQLGQTLSKIVLGSDDFARLGDDIMVKLNNSLGEVQVKSGNLIKAKPPENLQNIVDGSKLRKFRYTMDASVIQRFEYLRIPLLLEYKVVDKRMDVNLVGGLHSNFLVNEGVYLKDDRGATQQIGNTSSISRFNYSGSLGLGLEYTMAEHVNIYLEPTVDYFLNPINQDVTKTYPYSFAVYTGLSISF